MSDAGVHVVGLISDTHGQLRADVHTAFAGVELIPVKPVGEGGNTQADSSMVERL